MSAQAEISAHLAGAFRGASGQSATPKSGSVTKRFSIRFTQAELAYLRSKAGRRPLGAWCRERLLGEHAEKRAELKQPKLEDHQYAALLSALGESRLS